MAQTAYLEQRLVYNMRVRIFACVVVISACDGLDIIRIEMKQ